MNSFKDKLKNLIIESFGQNKNLNIHKNIIQNNNGKNILFTERKIPIKISRYNFDKQFEYPNFNYKNISTKNKSNRYKDNIYKNMNFENITINDFYPSKYNKSKIGNDYINKKYKNLYNKSYININNNLYNKNKTYLNYKRKSIYNLSNINNININNINIYKIKENNKLIKSHSTSSWKCLNLKNDNDISNKGQSQPKSYHGLKYNNSSNKKISKINYFESLISDKEKDYLITKNKNRISKPIKKQINSLIVENDLENISYKNNISNKRPRVLNSELFQFDNKYYNDISPITKFMYLNNEKNKKNFKIYNNYNSIFL